jgi:hypothetical protein
LCIEALTDGIVHAELAAFLVCSPQHPCRDGDGSASASALTGARQRGYRAGRLLSRCPFRPRALHRPETVALDIAWSGLVYCGGVAPTVTDEAIALIHSACTGRTSSRIVRSAAHAHRAR